MKPLERRINAFDGRRGVRRDPKSQVPRHPAHHAQLPPLHRVRARDGVSPRPPSAALHPVRALLDCSPSRWPRHARRRGALATCVRCACGVLATCWRRAGGVRRAACWLAATCWLGTSRRQLLQPPLPAAERPFAAPLYKFHCSLASLLTHPRRVGCPPPPAGHKRSAGGAMYDAPFRACRSYAPESQIASYLSCATTPSGATDSKTSTWVRMCRRAP